MPRKMKNQSKRLPWKKSFHYLKDYFVSSNEKLTAWLFLIGITCCVILLVSLAVLFPWVFSGFWAALSAKALIPFLISTGKFVAIAVVYTIAQVLKNYLMGKLVIRWRNWLTQKTLHQLFNKDNNYLDLKRLNDEIDNIAQRIQRDIKVVVNSTLELGFDFLQSFLTLTIFIPTLWIVGGTLTAAFLSINLVIPGYLVWVALFLAVIATFATHFIGKSLININKKTEQAEADLRQELEILNSDAENIAQEQAEHYYRQALNCKVEEIKKISSNKLYISSKLAAFQNFYLQVSFILPYLLASPLYFSSLFAFEQLMQIGMSFGQVSAALNWFVDAYEKLATYKACIERVLELQEVFDNTSLPSNPKLIKVKKRNKDTIHIKSLSIEQPQPSSSQSILRNLNLKLIPGQHLLIKGSSGLGKSTLFKVIGENWQYGSGKISLPLGKRMYFLPQKATLPHDTLKKVLAYPESAEIFAEKEFITALGKVGLKDFIPKLNQKRAWSKELSGGQQQKIAFARVLLKKPDWIFMDEATASLDEESEQRLYRELNKLKDTTIVSIAHRQTVGDYHHRIVKFRVNDHKEVEVEEQEKKEELNFYLDSYK